MRCAGNPAESDPNPAKLTGHGLGIRMTFVLGHLCISGMECLTLQFYKLTDEGKIGDCRCWRWPVEELPDSHRKSIPEGCLTKP